MAHAEAIDRRPGRPSRHPITVRYCENASIHAAMSATADKYRMSFSEVQRMVNRAGIKALKLDQDVDAASLRKLAL